MGFELRHCIGTLVLFCAGVVAATSQAQKTDVTVLVFDDAAAGAVGVGQAGREVERIYGAAGIRLLWIDCSHAPVRDLCRVSSAHNQLVLHIIHNGKASSDTIFGVAFIGTEGWGKYADIFFDRVRQGRRESGVDIPQLLGAVAAHELGHLLMGSHSHSWLGVMTPVWQAETLRAVNMGTLFFTSEQATVMKGRISREQVRLAGLETDVR